MWSMWWPNDMNIARKIKAYSILFVLFSPETEIPLHIRTPPAFLPGIPQDPKKLEETPSVPLYLPYQSCSPDGTPLANRPQRFSPAIELHFVQHLLVTLLPSLVIHHFVHPRYSLLVFGGSIKRTLCPCAHSTRRRWQH
jgi:hypothetical protein